jgi:arylsulfatase A-like enzyme
MNRRHFTAAFASAIAARPQATTPPNILVVLADDLGYGDLSSYGARDLRTPNIDALAKAGMRFTSFYANSPVCSPTRASLLTGRPPDVVGVPGVIRTHALNSWGRLAPDAVLLPQILRQAGYHTAIIGKWHLGLTPEDNPVRRGFHHFRGFLGDMMDDYYTHRRHEINYMRAGEEEIDPKGHATDLFTQWAVDYLQERKGQPGPFFLYLAYNAPHTPIQPPDESLQRVRQRQPGISEQRAKLVALIEHMDEEIGRVIQALKSNGQYDNTLILFTSDNGGQANVGANNGNLRGAKQNMYEGGIRVPACVVWNGRIQAGSTSDAVLQTMDILPTAAAAAGIAVRHEIEGHSFLSLLTGQSDSMPDRTLYWVRREGGRPYWGLAYYAVRRGDWKLLQNTPFSPLELFNVRADPLEKSNVAEEHPKVVTELAQALQKSIIKAGQEPWSRGLKDARP